MKLYELSTVFSELQRELEDGEPDQVPAALEKVESVNMLFEDKCKEIAGAIRNMEEDAKSIEQAADNMYRRAKAIKARVGAMKEYLRTNMERCKVHRIECTFFKIVLKDNPPKVTVTNEALVPTEYMRQPEPPPKEVDKKRILEDFRKDGVIPDGVEITQGNHVEIK